MFSDRFFFVDTEKAIRQHAKHSKSPVYYFLFSYILKQDSLFGNFLPVPGRQINFSITFPQKCSELFSGVQHSDDGKLLFRIMGTPETLPKKDEKAKELLINFVYDYATTG